jgi:hypothetical protein
MEGSYTPPPAPPAPPAPPGVTTDLVYPTTPAKDPILILVLNLLLGGVGYLIIGQKTKGIVALATWLILGVVTCGFGFGIVGILTAIDGFLQAQHLQKGMPVAQWSFFNDHR